MTARRVLFVENSIGFGGSVVALGRLLRRIDPRRFVPFVVVSHESQRQHLRSAGVDCDVDVLCMSPALVQRCARSRVERPFRAAAASLDRVRRVIPYGRALAATARRHRVDLVHLNNSIVANLGGLLAARLVGVPAVLKQHGYEWHSRDIRLLARAVSYFLPDSDDVARDLCRLGVPPARLRVTYCPIELSDHDRTPAAGIRAELGIPETAPTFGIAGCLQEWKGQHVFLDAAARVLARLPHARALVIGGVPEDADGTYEARLRCQASERGIADRVIFTGHRDDMPRIYPALDVCVHASIVPEPFGMVVGEAMASRRAVVASRAGGPVEIVEDGVSGVLTRPGDPDEMAAAVLRLLTDRDAARRMGEAGRRRVEALFGAQRHAEVTQEVYEQVLSESRRDAVR